MEPWSNHYEQEKRAKKSLRRKMLEAAIVIYAGLAIFITSAIAEGITIPIAARLKRRRRAKDAGR